MSEKQCCYSEICRHFRGDLEAGEICTMSFLCKHYKDLAIPASKPSKTYSGKRRGRPKKEKMDGELSEDLA